MGSEQARKYHSVNFGNKNTWDDWGIIPTSRPSVAPPEVKKYDAGEDFSDGKIDLTDVYGTPTYGQAKGSMEFIIPNPGTIEYASTGWVAIRNEMMRYLHNRRRRMILDDDPDYYYEGRFQVNFAPGKNWSKVTIDYAIDTYYQKNELIYPKFVKNGDYLVIAADRGEDDPDDISRYYIVPKEGGNLVFETEKRDQT